MEPGVAAGRGAVASAAGEIEAELRAAVGRPCGALGNLRPRRRLGPQHVSASVKIDLDREEIRGWACAGQVEATSRWWHSKRTVYFHGLATMEQIQRLGGGEVRRQRQALRANPPPPRRGFISCEKPAGSRW